MSPPNQNSTLLPLYVIANHNTIIVEAGCPIETTINGWSDVICPPQGSVWDAALEHLRSIRSKINAEDFPGSPSTKRSLLRFAEYVLSGRAGRRAIIPIIYRSQYFVNFLPPYPDAEGEDVSLLSVPSVVEVLLLSPPEYRDHDFNTTLSTIYNRVRKSEARSENRHPHYDMSMLFTWLLANKLYPLEGIVGRTILQDLAGILHLRFLALGEEDDLSQRLELNLLSFLRSQGVHEYSGHESKYSQVKGKTSTSGLRGSARRYREAVRSVTGWGDPTRRTSQFCFTIDRGDNHEEIIRVSSEDSAETTEGETSGAALHMSLERGWGRSFNLRRAIPAAFKADNASKISSSELQERFRRCVIVPIEAPNSYFSKFLSYLAPSESSDGECIASFLPSAVEIIISAPTDYLFLDVFVFLTDLGKCAADLCPGTDDRSIYDLAVVAFWLAENAARDTEDEEARTLAQCDLSTALFSRFQMSREDDDLVYCFEVGLCALKLCGRYDGMQSSLPLCLAKIFKDVWQNYYHNCGRAMETITCRIREAFITISITDPDTLSVLAEAFYHTSIHGVDQLQDIRLSTSFGSRAIRCSHPGASDWSRNACILWGSLTRLLELDGSILLSDGESDETRLFRDSVELVRNEPKLHDDMCYGRFLCVLGARRLIRGLGYNHVTQFGAEDHPLVRHADDYNDGLSLCKRGVRLLLSRRDQWVFHETILVDSIGPTRQVLHILSKDSPERVELLDFLSMALTSQRNNNRDSLQTSHVDGGRFAAEVTALHHEVLALLPPESPERLKHLYDLAWEAIRHCCEFLAHWPLLPAILPDLHEAHRICEDFLAACADVPSLNRCSILSMLPIILFEEYVVTDNLVSLDQAFTYASEAIEWSRLLSDTNAKIAKSLQARCLVRLWHLCNREDSLAYNPQASHQFLLLFNAVESSQTREDSQEDEDHIANFHRETLHEFSMPVFGWSVSHKTRLEMAHMGSSAASIYAGRLCNANMSSKAVEAIEEGRTLFWAHALCSNTSFSDLPVSLRGPLQQLSLSLDDHRHATTIPNPAMGSGFSTEALKLAAEMRRKSLHFAGHLDQVRQTIHGKEQLGLPQSIDSLRAAARDGPVVILFSHDLASEAEASYHYALCLQKTGAPISIILEKVTKPVMNALKYCFSEAGLMGDLSSVTKNYGEILGIKNLRNTSQSTNDITRRDRKGRVKVASPEPDAGEVWRRVCKLMWDVIVKPIVDSLDLPSSQGQSRSRLWWYPTGDFAHLPVHAAGDYISPGGECCSSYVVSSYTPTLDNLIGARKSMPSLVREDAKMLLAAVPHPYAGSMLGGTVKELKNVRKVVPETSILPLPPTDDTLADARAGISSRVLMNSLPGATMFHVACHGRQYPADPLRNSFILRDRSLPLSELMRLKLPNAFLAFLSACETAQVEGDNGENQFVNLAAAMLFVGFKSVVGTMWRMNDSDGADVAEMVYRQLFAGDRQKLDPNDIPYALDDAVRVMREEGLSPERWAPFIHLGI